MVGQYSQSIHVSIRVTMAGQYSQICVSIRVTMVGQYWQSIRVSIRVTLWFSSIRKVKA